MIAELNNVLLYVFVWVRNSRKSVRSGCSVSNVYCVLQEETSLDVSDLVGIDPEIYNTVSHLQVSYLLPL
jgi:hypothetical protein